MTGYRGHDIEAEIAGLEICVARNIRFVDGMASSIALGVQRAAELDPDGIMIMLADMPMLDAVDLDTLIDAFRKGGAKTIVRAACEGVPGNPVIFPRSAFGGLQGLNDDRGARQLISQLPLDVINVEIGIAAKIDIDTAEQLASFGGQLEAY
ncbi:nucleotidyltransferase family protein (plasmid) [Sinorhizobium sp. B11]